VNTRPGFVSRNLPSPQSAPGFRRISSLLGSHRAEGLGSPHPGPHWRLESLCVLILYLDSAAYRHRAQSAATSCMGTRAPTSSFSNGTPWPGRRSGGHDPRAHRKYGTRPFAGAGVHREQWWEVEGHGERCEAKGVSSGEFKRRFL
jgi:hypothetical protein